MPNRTLEVHVIDYAIRKRFQHLAQLAPLRLYRLYDNRREAGAALDEFEALARFRHHELFTAETPTLAAYNAAGFSFERYRVLLIHLNDFPGESQEDRTQLLNLLDAAFDAGIYVLAYVNTETLPPPPADRKDPPPAFWSLLARRYPQIVLSTDEAGVNMELVRSAKTASLLDRMAELGLNLAAPSEDLPAIVERRHALAASNDDQARDFLTVPIGRTPDGRKEINYSLGAKSDCNNAFMVGMSGSGKTTLLNNLIVGIAERYTSDELRLYLMDYKDGVEFQIFADHPNCEKIFLDNKDTEAATRLLESFVGAIDERAAMCRSLTVKDIDAYNALAETRLPRLLLIVDEVQRLLTDDAKGRRFNELLKDVVKRGRAFGVHILLSTQTLINANIDRDTMSQIALRIAFKLNNDSDCDRIFNYGNQAPRNLEKYEFIYNPDSGHKEANLRARALPPPDIKARLSAVRAQREPWRCLTPEIVMNAPHSATATSASPPATVNMPDWLNQGDKTMRASRDRNNEDVLAQIRARIAAGELIGNQDVDTPATKAPTAEIQQATSTRAPILGGEMSPEQPVPVATQEQPATAPITAWTIDLPDREWIDAVQREARVSIARFNLRDGESGWPFEKIFSPQLVSGCARLALIDPYLDQPHQVRNLKEFLLAVAAAASVKEIFVLTSNTWTGMNSANVQNMDEIRKDLFSSFGTTLKIEVDSTIHDRYVICDHGVLFKLGRGLDIYKPVTGLASHRPGNRHVRRTEIDVFAISRVAQ